MPQVLGYPRNRRPSASRAAVHLEENRILLRRVEIGRLHDIAIQDDAVDRHLPNSALPRFRVASFAFSFSLVTTVRTDAWVGRRTRSIVGGVVRFEYVCHAWMASGDMLYTFTPASDAGVTCSAFPFPSRRVRSRSRNLPKACEYLELAGERAASLNAIPQAVDLWQRAQKLAAQAGDAATEQRLLDRLQQVG